MPKLLVFSLAVGLTVAAHLAAGSEIGPGTATTSASSGDPFTPAGLTLGAQFRPYANTQNVNMWVCATSLFKGGAPTLAGGGPNPHVIPLAAQDRSPATISGSGFTPTPKAMPLSTSSTFFYDSYSWPRRCSTPATFYGASTSAFSGTVDVAAVWATTDTTLPAGSYSGYVQLYVATIP